MIANHQHAAIVAAHNAGEGLKVIAYRYGVSHQRISQIARQHGLPARRAPNGSRPAIVRKTDRINWTAEDDAAALRARKQGQSGSRIASMFGDRTRNAVLARFRRLDAAAPLPDERPTPPALHLGDVLTGVADFFSPGSSEQAREHDRQHCAEVPILIPCSNHNEAI